MKTGIPSFAKTGLVLRTTTSSPAVRMYSAPGALRRCINYSLEGDRIVPFCPIGVASSAYGSGAFPSFGGYAIPQVKYFFPIYCDNQYKFAFTDNVKVWAPTSLDVNTDITRLAGNYTADNRWDFFQNGNVALFNNENDHPQVWSPVSTATRLVNLPNWDPNHRCKVMIFFKNFFIALGVTKSGTYSPSLMKWSSLAPIDTYPASWDHTDPSTLAGELLLPGDNTPIIDAYVYDDFLYIFKINSVIRVRFTGGNEIFYPEILTTSWGLYCKGAFCEVDGRLCIFSSNGDIGYVSGRQIELISDWRVDEYLKTQYVYYSFISSNSVKDPILLRYDAIRQKLYLIKKPQGPNDVVLAWNRKWNVWESYQLPPVEDACFTVYSSAAFAGKLDRALLSVGLDSSNTSFADKQLFSNLSAGTSTTTVVSDVIFYGSFILEYYSLFAPMQATFFGIPDITTRKNVYRIWAVTDSIEPHNEILGTTVVYDATLKLIDYEIRETETPPFDNFNTFQSLSSARDIVTATTSVLNAECNWFPLRAEGRDFGLEVITTNSADFSASDSTYYGFLIEWEAIEYNP